MEKKGKNTLKSTLFILFFTIVGLVGGYLLAPYLGKLTLGGVLYAVSILIVSFPLHVILHESGHLLGGLLSGYDFIMFRFFNTVWIKTDDGLSKRKEYVPGILGQALMVPPETDGEPPFFLYHASGILTNVITGFIFILLGQVLSVSWLAYFFNISSLVAFFLAVTNTVPTRGTDGYNILQYFRREAASSEMTHLLYMYRDMVKGESLEHLQKYVDFSAFDSFENPNAATIYSLRATYLFEKGDFKGARKIYQSLYENLNILFGGHRPAVILNYLYALLLTDPLHPEVPKLIKSDVYAQVSRVKQSDYIRYQAAVELYYNKNFEKAEALLDEGAHYTSLAPTVMDQHFEESMYQYLKEDLAKIKAMS